MPESRVRRKSAYTAPQSSSGAPKPNPRWWAPVMVALLVIGLIYLVVSYISQFAFPIGAIGYWNLAVGFGILMTGFVMTTRWR